MQMRFFELICFLFFASSIVAAGNSDRIAGGDNVTLGEYPYIVAVKVDEEFKCGGFIYNERWIVTAASCVVGLSPSLVTIEAGIVTLDPPEDSQQRIQVLSIHVYNSYNDTTGLHDIALVETVTSFTFDTNVNFVYYDESNANTADFIGWGASEEGGNYSNNLKYSNLTVSGADCSIPYGEEYVKAYMICAKAENSPCQYDQGSPMAQGIYVVGIMSRNNGCGIAGTTNLDPTIFTRLSVYYSWIATTAGPQPTWS